MNQKIIVIGGGIGGLAFANLAAKKGYAVTLLEKNEQVGGVAGQFEAEGFRFDMGPSWYLMPDVFENYFALLGERVEDHLDLVRLDPSYRIFFQGQRRSFDFYSDLERDIPTFESLEPGCGPVLRDYLEKSKYQYEIAIRGFMYKNSDTVFDFLNKQTATEGRELEVFSKMSDYVKKHFKTDEVQKIMQYTLVFLGSSPYNTPALYNIMSHIDFNMGVFYPQNGIHQIPLALQNIGKKLGVEYRTDAAVAQINTKRGPAVKSVLLENGEELEADIIVSNTSIHHTESLLPKPYRDHSQRYWDKRTLAPSALIMYLGVEGKLDSLTHHNLLFSPDWEKNFAEIFDKPQWPTDPSLYICAPSKTDPTVAPEGCENLFVLVPIAARTEYTEEELEEQSNRMLRLIGREMNLPGLRERIVYKKIFSVKDFAARYNKLGGTALGLAHTISQTAILRPNNCSKKVENLLYVGADTNPGIGMPIQLISAELAFKRIIGDKSVGHLTAIESAASEKTA
jgi:phytoene desaturase